jgi:hypothetical protein
MEESGITRVGNLDVRSTTSYREYEKALNGVENNMALTKGLGPHRDHYS